MFVALGVVAFVPTATAQIAAPGDLTGTWQITWDGDNKNTNRLTLKYEAGTFTGTYINDSRENCPTVGRIEKERTVLVLFIACPEWDILARGNIKQAKTIDGRYLAYGDSKGVFSMSRRE